MTIKPNVQCFCEISGFNSVAVKPELNHKYNQNLQKIDLKINFYFTATLVYVYIFNSFLFYIIYFSQHAQLAKNKVPW